MIGSGKLHWGGGAEVRLILRGLQPASSASATQQNQRLPHLRIPAIARQMIDDSPTAPVRLDCAAGDGAPSDETAPCSVFCASRGTLSAPALQSRRSDAASPTAMKAPAQIPALALRAASCWRYIRWNSGRNTAPSPNSPSTS
jgi:hypothetical protein